MGRFYLTLLLSVLFLFKSATVNAQEKPLWYDGYYDETSISYLKVLVGTSNGSYDNAHENAIKQLFKDNVLDSDVEIKMYGDMFDIKSNNNVRIKARVIAEYREMIAYEYICHILVQVVKDPSYDFDKVTISDDYPFSARVFLPGMAQMHKGQSAKGIGFIAGEIVFVGSSIMTHSMIKSNVNKALSTHNTSLKYKYLRNANICQTVRNVSIASAAALYLWNVIDGIAAKGKETVHLGQNGVSVSPYADFNSTGIALNFKF